MKKHLYRALFRAGALVRNPSLQSQYSALRNSERWSLDDLRTQQWRRLEQLLEFARSRSPYYQEVLSRIDWDPRGRLSEEQFVRIPYIDKKTLIAQSDRIHTQYDFRRTFLCETSGTTGETLTFRRDESWDSFNRAGVLRGYDWHGVHPWEFNIYFWGYNLAAAKLRRTRLLDGMVNRYRIFDYSPESIALFIKNVNRATYIEGYSSMIYGYALRMQDHGVDAPKLRLVKGTSEKILPHYQPVVEQAFGRRIVSEYGAAETGLIAFECAHGSMHVNMEGVFLETETDGEVIVTNLLSLSFPVIRYRLGDVIRLAPKEFRCDCGMAHPVIEEVTGRIGRSIVGRTQEFPSLTLYYIFKNLFFERGLALTYQGRQAAPGVLQLAIREKSAPGLERAIRDECERYFGGDIEMEVLFDVELQQTRGKLRDFVSQLSHVKGRAR